MRRLLFTFTSHGFGHLTRTLEILAALLREHPGLDVTVAARAPEWLVQRALPRPVRLVQRDYEPGAAQLNCFEVDVERTRLEYRRWIEDLEERRRAEERFFDAGRFDGVVADIPALPVAVAAQRQVPVVAVGNFTWDWLLEPIVDSDVVERLRDGYAPGDWFLRLPLGPDHSPFRRVEEVPLVGRRATLEREEVRRRLGWEFDDRPLVLVCVGGWGAGEWEPIRVRGCGDLGFVVVDELPVTIEAPTLRLPNELREGLGFPDLVAAADVVLTKPGYGISSECLLNRTPMVGIERRDFREEPYLVRGLERDGVFVSLSLSDFFSGEWEPAIRSARLADATWAEHPTDGAQRVARRLSELLSLSPTASPAEKDR